MTTKKKIFIVAGNVQEFETYRSKKLHEWTEYGGPDKEYFPEYVCVHNAWQLKGLNEIEGYYIGSYKNRTDLDEVDWCIKAIKGRQNNVDNLKGIANGTTNGTTAVGSMLPTTMLPIGNGGTISNINTTAITQYSYPNPNLEQRTKALEEALAELRQMLDNLEA
jgi:hypothetical protein